MQEILSSQKSISVSNFRNFDPIYECVTADLCTHFTVECCLSCENVLQVSSVMDKSCVTDLHQNSHKLLRNWF